jgi:hypothetical protein
MLRGTDLAEPDMAEDLSIKVRHYLQSLSGDQVPVTYQALAQAMGLRPPNTIRQISEILEVLMAEDAAANRPFISALVISKGRSGLPAQGFFDCARKLGRYAGGDDQGFHRSQLPGKPD